MKGFYELTVRGRALRLRQIALQALERYDIDVNRVRLVTNETNGIFRVDTADGKTYILRVTDPAGCHGLDEIRSEMMWLAALRRDTDLGVPEPLPTRDGALVATVEIPGVPEARHCTVFSWLHGQDLADRLTPENMRRLGQYTALLHRHAAGFAAPEGFRIRMLDKVFYYSDPAFPYVEPVVLFDDLHRDLFPVERREIFLRVADRVQAALDELYAEKNGLRVIHNDLHQWNVKVYRDKVYALDFEDLARGYPVQDIATTLYYFDTHDQYDVLFQAYKRGYSSCSDWPERYPGQIGAFIAGRDLMLANYVVISDNPEYRAMVPDYLARMEKRFRQYLAKDDG